MSVSLTGTGGLFTRLGKILAQIRNVNGFRGESAAVGSINTGYFYYVDVATATTSGKATQLDLDGAPEPSVLAGVVQPDVPRNVVINFTDGDTSISAFSLTVVGVGPDGAAASETFTFAGGLDQAGSVIFATITSITLTSITGNGAGDLLDIGHGSKYGVFAPVGTTGFTLSSVSVDGVAESPSATSSSNRSWTPTTAANGTRDFSGTYTYDTFIATWGSTSGAKVKDADNAFDEIAAQYQSALQHVMDGHYQAKQSLIDSLRSAQDYLVSIAKETAYDQVHADAVLIDAQLSTAIRELIRQMVVSSDTVKANTVSASVAAASTNTGNATCIASVVGPDGKNREYVLPEVIEVKVTQDAQGGGITAGSEQLSVRGEVKAPSALDYTWPDGSEANSSLTMIDAEVDGAGSESESSNMLVNGHFDDFTANAPDDWTILVGAAATDILEESSTVYRSGGKALEFIGTGGGPLSSIAQTLNPWQGDSSNANCLKPSSVLAVNVYMRKSAGLVAGVVEISLVNGSNAIITNDAGTELKKQVAFGTLTTSFAAYNEFFQLPKVLPSTIKLRVRASTALTSGESVFIDDLCLVKAKEAYTGGPYIAIFRASTESILNDQWNVTVANNQGGLIQSGFDQMFGMRELGMQLPSLSNGSHTIAETLVV